MATQFKNLYTTLSTSSSTSFETKDLLTCPVGKTILVQTVHHHNSTTDTSGNNSSMHALYFRDYSAYSSASQLSAYLTNALAGSYGTIAKGGSITNRYPLVLEENDELKVRISEPNQDISLAYVEMDTGVKQKYRSRFSRSTIGTAVGGTFAANMLLAPQGTTYIVNFIMVMNPWAHTQNFRLKIGGLTDSVAAKKTLWDYDFQQNGQIVWQQAIVLNGGDLGADDQLILESTWDTDDSASSGGAYFYVSYLEIKKPDIRS
tara:strand:+ start:866 stop:1648 length:783 start_codon:yes stop_codon:yes gene_type:complete